MKVFCAILILGCSLGLRLRVGGAEYLDGIDTVVHDSIVSRQEVEVLTLMAVPVLRNQYRTQPDLFEKKVTEAERDNREQLVERQLVLHEFKTAGYNLPESVLDELVKERMQKAYGDSMTLIKSLQAKGLTREKFRQEVRDRFILEVMRQKNISQEIIISPHKVEAYYLAHKEDFKVEDEVKLRMIVLNQSPDGPPAQKLAEEIAAKLKEGATFEEMEKIYSQETARNQGGRWYEKEQLTKGLADIAFSLEPGHFSGVLSRTPGDEYWIYQYENGRRVLARHYGADPDSKKENLVEEKKFGPDSSSDHPLPEPREYFIMQVQDKRASHFKALGEVRDQIERNLQLEEGERLKNQWVARLRKKTFVRYY